MKTEHPEEYSAKLQDLEKDSTCDICLKEFANAMLLKKHKNGVHFKSHQELYQHKNKNKKLWHFVWFAQYVLDSNIDWFR